MTLDRLGDLASTAMRDVPHVDFGGTLANLGWLGREEREAAANVYAALIGEKTLPAHIGIKHALPPVRKPLVGRDRVNRAAAARRILEDRRDAA